MNKKVVLLALSLFIAGLDVVFVYINYRFSHENFMANVSDEAETNFATFKVALDQTYSDLLMVATLYAKNPKIQDLFYNGVKAVEAEGGGPGGAQAALWRDRLFAEIGESWLAASQQFRIRQLHFHLGPGSISYLRVHRVAKFGDNMDDIRHIIVNTNKTQELSIGFETGRVYSGLRGVVPMFATDPQTGETIHTGALEAGTSFSKILEIIDQGVGSAITVLLTRDHIQETMWPDARNRLFKKMDIDCRCVIEASSRPGVEDVLRLVPFNDNGRPNLETPYMVKMGAQTYAATFFPLRDFLGQQNPERANVGAVMIWTDVTQQLHDLDQQQMINVVYAVVGFIILEIFLFIAFAFVTRNLEQTVAERTVELVKLNDQLKHEIAVKNRFFSIIAHDLRSPFNSLLGMTRLIEEKVHTQNPEKLSTFAHHIHEAGEKFFSLLQGLLEWTQHQMHGERLDLTTVELSDLTTDVIAHLSHSAGDKQITLNNQVPSMTVTVDANMVATVLRNLLSNAIKFVNHGGQVEVTAQALENGGITVSVTDNGVGLDEAIIDKLFAIDEKVTTIGTDGEMGTGLGLPLCKSMIARHGGDIHGENVAGGGARFTFTLPPQSAP